jgi:quinolinate synthase
VDNNPDKKKGDNIPMPARILAVADAYASMTDNRPYRKAHSHEEAVQEIMKNSGKQFIVATETGMVHALKKKRPDGEFILASERAVCPNMKRITVEKILWSLEDNKYVITVPDEIRTKAKRSLERMVEVVPAK